MAISEKISRYENFLNDTLRDDLKKELTSRDSLFEDVAAYTQLRQTINCMQELPKEEGLRTQVDIGCNFYVQAHV